MTSYTIQQHIPSGERHVLAYDDTNTIVAVSEALHHRAVDALVGEPYMLWYIRVSEEDAEWANGQQWQPPMVATGGAGDHD